MRQRVAEYVSKLQDDIVTAFERLDPNAPPFKRDSWTRAQLEGGHGLFRKKVQTNTLRPMHLCNS